MDKKLQACLDSIKPLDQAMIDRSKAHLAQLTKPPGSLGRLEYLAMQIAGITGEITPDLNKKAVVIMAADHGVCDEGVSAFPQSVTREMVLNFLRGGAAVNVLARQANADVYCVDIGVKETFEPHPQLIQAKIGMGTRNIAQGPAMSEEEAIQAILTGIKVVQDLSERGYRVIATGEMGIGNTTVSSALLSAITGVDPGKTIGYGTGIDEEQKKHKQHVVEQALRVNRVDRNNPIELLAKLGGYEIAGLVGVIIGAAQFRMAVVIDGFISSAAAMIAGKLCPVVRDYMIASHLSQEQGHRLMLEVIALQPMIEMDMRLGEGTGAVLAFHFLDAAMAIMREMATFQEAGVSTAVKPLDAAQSQPGKSGSDSS